MKTVVIILSIVCLGLAVGYYQSTGTAKREAETSAGKWQSLSNQVAEMRTKLAMEQGTSGTARSNLQSALDRRTIELLVTSNRLAQTALQLGAVQQDLRAAQTDLQTKAGAVATLEAQREELHRRLEAIPVLQKEVNDAREMLTRIRGERDELGQSLGRARVEKADLERTLDDPMLLRLQIKKAEDNTALRKQLAADGRVHPSDKRARLELQPDGTVRPLVPAASPTGKN